MSAPSAPPRLDAAFREHNPSLLRYLQRLTQNAEIAGDVAQQSWLRLLAAGARGSPVPDHPAELRALLFTVARRVFIDAYRRRHFERHTLRLQPGELESLLPADAQAPPPEHEAERMLLRRAVSSALRELPAAQRQAVALWQAGHDIRSMARLAGAPRETVLSRKKYAFGKLRARLAPLAAGALPSA